MQQKKNLSRIKKCVKIKIFKILEFDQYLKSDKAQCIIYADLECIIENLFTTKVSKHIPSGFSISTISSLRSIENKHDVYRGKDCMKRFCEYLKEYAMKIINFKKKKNNIINKIAAGII